MGTTSQQFCLKWNNHSSNMLNVFETLLTSEQLVDVTLACDGLSLKAHKMVLSACSPFFQSLFQENPCKHPIVILKDIRYADLKAIIDFMYKGEVNVGQAHLSALLKTAETLKVKGLAEVSGEDGQSSSGSVVQQEVPVYPQAQHSSDVANIVQTIDSSVRPSSDSPTGRKRKRTKWKNRGGQGGGGGNDSETDDQGPAAKNQEIVSADVIEDDSSSIGVVDGPSDTRNAKDSRIIIEEATIVGDYVEPAALMEQNMTTDNVQPVSSQLMLTNATSKDNNINVPESRSYDTTVATMNPETVDLVDRPEDVKPTALVSYEEPPMSPNATSSHHSQDDSNSMTMYMDPNSMPAIAGPSNYQQDKQPSASAGQEPHLEPEHIVQVEQVDEAEHIPQMEQVDETENIPQVEQVDETEHIVQVEQVDETEHIEHIVQVEQVDKTEHIVQMEQVDEAEHIPQMEQVDEAEHMEQVDEAEHIVQMEQVVETEHIVQMEQVVETEHIPQMEQVDEAEHIIQMEEVIESEEIVYHTEELVQIEHNLETNELVHVQHGVGSEELVFLEHVVETDEAVQMEHNLEDPDGIVNLDHNVETENLEHLEHSVQTEQLGNMEPQQFLLVEYNPTETEGVTVMGETSQTQDSLVTGESMDNSGLAGPSSPASSEDDGFNSTVTVIEGVEEDARTYIYYEGYRWCIKYVGKKSIRWKCSTKSNCSAAFYTDLNYQNPSPLRHEHNHEPSVKEMEQWASAMNM